MESYYDIMKNRLSLENFSGTTVLSVKQDFYATMFISNLESVLSHGLNEELEDGEVVETTIKFEFNLGFAKVSRSIKKIKK